MTTFSAESTITSGQEEVKPEFSTKDNKENFDSQIAVLEQRMKDKDSFIEQLKKEAQELRESIADKEYDKAKSKSVEEILEEVRKLKEASSKSGTALDTKELAAKVKQELEQEQTKKQQEDNFKQVSAKLTTVFGGDKVDSKVKEAAEANGLSFDDMINLAHKSPKAVYKMLGIDTPNMSLGSQFAKSSVNTQSANFEHKKDLAYYSQLRRDNPMEYWKPEVQREFRKLFIKDN